MTMGKASLFVGLALAAACLTTPAALGDVVSNQTYQIHDDFEHGRGLWLVSSTNDNSQFTEQGWELGTPYAGAGAGCPSNANGGANCWGTWLGSSNWVCSQANWQGSPILNGYYPGTNSFAMRAWLQSPVARVQYDPTVEFDAFWNLAYGDTAMLQVATEDGIWQTVGDLESLGQDSGDAWVHVFAPLPATMAGHSIKLRFYVITLLCNTAPGVYIDNFDLYSFDPPGIYFSGLAPATVAMPTNNMPLSVVISNTTTTDLNNVECTFYSLDTGVSVSGGVRVAFGTLPAGASATGTVLVSSSSNVYASAQVPIGCDAFVRGVFLNTSDQALGLASNAVIQAGTNMLTVVSTPGVVDWMGRGVSGNGSPASAFYQVIDAGTNGVIDAPRPNGLPGGDDRLLYSYAENLSFGRFGALNVSSNSGFFNRTFLQSLPAGRKVFVRAWDGPTFDQSVAYGDSGLSNVTGAAQQTIDFGRWTVNVPTQPNRDWNGDGIPDGWSILHGLDPRATVINPPALQLLSGMSCSRTGYKPLRVEVWSNWVYILYLNNAGNAGLVEVRDQGLAGVTQTVTQVTKSGDNLKSVAGMDIDQANGRLLVAEASTAKRIAVYNLSPASGALSYSMCWTNTQGGSPSDLAVDSTGAVYVADNSTNLYCYSPSGVPSVLSWPPSTTYPTNQVLVSVFRDNLYRTYNDSSVKYNQIDRYTFSTQGGPFPVGNVSSANTGLGDLKAPSKVFEGVGGRLYATDTLRNRIQIFDANANALAMLPSGSIANGTAIGQFNQPKGIWAVATKTGQHTIYVADYGNARVQRLAVCLDANANGIDDTWEDLNGLNGATITSSTLDTNANDNLTYLGEYLLGQKGLMFTPNVPATTTNLFFNAGGTPIPAGIPPQVTNVTASFSASNTLVTITAWYDRSPTNALPVTLSLAGGAYLASGHMTLGSIPNTCVYNAYAIQVGDSGWADARVAGTFQNPMVYNAANLFDVTNAPPGSSFALQALDLALSGFTNQPPILTTNEAVTISAQFSAAVGSALVTLTGPDGATLTNDSMSITGSGANYAYQVAAAPVEGWVTVGVTAQDSLLVNSASAQGVFAIVWPRIEQMATPPPTVTWSTVTGITYQVQSRTNLAHGTWSVAATTNVTAGTNAVYIDRSAATTQRFYQVTVPR